MSQYMINCSPNHAKYIPKTQGQTDSGVIQIVSKNKTIDLTSGDQFLSLDFLSQSDAKSGMEKKDRYTMKFKGSIKDKNEAVIASFEDLNYSERQELERYKRGQTKKEVRFYRHDVDVKIDNLFEKNPFLDDYTYSLYSVYNYIQPYRHFSRRYTKVEDFDYKTFKNEELFATRTVFGRLFYSLPTENQLEFLQIAIQTYKTTNFSEIPIGEGVLFLQDYTKKVTSLGKVIQATYDLLKSDFSEYLNPDEIGFEFVQTILKNKKKVKEYTGDKISVQAQIFEEAFSLEDKILGIVEEVTSKEQIEKQTRFIKKFKSKQWPIKINI